MRGRKPIPAAIKLLRGNPGKGPLTVPVGAGQEVPVPPCPSWLDSVAHEEWQRVAPALAKVGLLAHSDVAALAAYCQCYADWSRAVATLTREGRYIKDRFGETKVHPAVRDADALLKQLRAFAVEFGFTPSSRGRVDISLLAGKPDELEQFLAEQ
jgi:P27 family predicted phage terminase small subunit